MEEIVLAPHTTLQVGASEFSHPTLTFLHRYWNEKRGARKMPARADINPSDCRAHLNWIFLADVLPGMHDFRYRLVGSMVAAYFDVQGTDQSLTQVFSRYGEAAVASTLFIYRKTAKHQVPVRLTGQANWDGNGLEPYETVYLPLSDDDTSTNMILSAFVFDRDAVLINRAVAREHGDRPAGPPTPARKARA